MIIIIYSWPKLIVYYRSTKLRRWLIWKSLQASSWFYIIEEALNNDGGSIRAPWKHRWVKQKIGTLKFIYNMVLPCCHSGCLLYCDTYFRIKFIRHFDELFPWHWYISSLLIFSNEPESSAKAPNWATGQHSFYKTWYALGVTACSFIDGTTLKDLPLNDKPKRSFLLCYYYCRFSFLYLIWFDSCQNCG